MDELIKKIKDGDMDAFTQLVELFDDRAVNLSDVKRPGRCRRCGTRCIYESF